MAYSLFNFAGFGHIAVAVTDPNFIPCMFRRCKVTKCIHLVYLCSKNIYIGRDADAPSCYELIIEKCLPELRCKEDHMLKSIVQILFNNKCKVERDGNE